jgi:SAM-dependent methyltransferase
MSSSEHDEIRQKVSKAYAKAVSAEAPSGGGCCSTPTTKGVAAQLAGYCSEELGALPADAVVNSFGCGNPLAFTAVQPGQVVVDLGSGAGIDILLAAKKVGPSGRVIGVDMTDEIISRAHENIAASGLTNVEVRKGLIEELPVDDASVDWVLSNCVINLSPDKPRVFAEIARVLRSGGQMLVSDIVAEDLPEWIKASEHLYSSCVAGAVSEEAYLQGLRDAGMVDVAVVDRLVYERSQLSAFIASELEPSSAELENIASPSCCGPTSSCCGEATSLLQPDQVQQIAGALEGKIASIKVQARKP